MTSQQTVAEQKAVKSVKFYDARGYSVAAEADAVGIEITYEGIAKRGMLTIEEFGKLGASQQEALRAKRVAPDQPPQSPIKEQRTQQQPAPAFDSVTGAVSSPPSEIDSVTGVAKR